MNNLKKLRKEKNLTLKKVAEDNGIAESQLSFYENGKRQPRDQKTWENLADYFEVSVSYLMGLDDNSRDKLDIMNNFNLWLKFTQRVYNLSDIKFLELINSYVEFYKGQKPITMSNLNSFKSKELAPTDFLILVIANLLNVDFQIFKEGQILSAYERPKIEALLKKSGFSIVKEPAISNLINALNSAPIMQFSFPDIIQMYSNNLIEKNQIKDRISLVSYLSERQAGLEEATTNDSIPVEIRMDLEIEANSISEQLHRLEAYTEIFE